MCKSAKFTDGTNAVQVGPARATLKSNFDCRISQIHGLQCEWYYTGLLLSTQLHLQAQGCSSFSRVCNCCRVMFQKCAESKTNQIQRHILLVSCEQKYNFHLKTSASTTYMSISDRALRNYSSPSMFSSESRICAQIRARWLSKMLAISNKI